MNSSIDVSDRQSFRIGDFNDIGRINKLMSLVQSPDKNEIEYEDPAEEIRQSQSIKNEERKGQISIAEVTASLLNRQEIDENIEPESISSPNLDQQAALASAVPANNPKSMSVDENSYIRD